MKKIYITFSGSVYDNSTKKIVDNGPRLGADEVWVYDDVWVTKHEFYIRNKWLWDHPHKRGFGWYAWKPLILLDALSRLEDGDIVMFTDADTYPIRDFSVLYDICNKEGIMLFEANGQIHRNWCKKDCYIVMNQNDPKYYDLPHGVARFMLFKKGDWDAYQFLMEWLTYCVNPLANTFDKSILGPEIKDFIEHRAEQAIMTNLAHKYGYKLYRGADEIGESSKNDRNLYQQLFSQKNDFAEKTGGNNVTAPVEGSRYRNVPDPSTKIMVKKTTGRSMGFKKVVDKFVTSTNLIKYNSNKNIKKIAFKITPRFVKEKVKSIIKK